jgi:restriction system protein
MKRAWLVRAGRLGEREVLALEDNIAVIGWLELPDLATVDTRESLMTLLQQAYPDANPKRLLNWRGQIWAFLRTISEGDLVVLPLKGTSAVAIGQVTGSYSYRPDLPLDARHTRSVKWLRPDLPRTAISQDLLYSLGAFLTVCEIKRQTQRVGSISWLELGKIQDGHQMDQRLPAHHTRRTTRPQTKAPAQSTSSATPLTRSAQGSPRNSRATGSPD